MARHREAERFLQTREEASRFETGREHIALGSPLQATMGNISARQVVKTRSIYHDPSIRQALQQRRFATATAQKKPQAPNPQLRVALQARYGELAKLQSQKPQDSGKVRQLVASTGAAYRAPACDPWARGQLFR